jgi:hypothetical protein
MTFKTKVRYLKIIHTHKQIDTSLKENAPYISKSRIFELTARRLLAKERMNLSRPTFYRALKCEKKLLREEPFLK